MAGVLLLLVGVLAGFFIARGQASEDRAALVETQVELSAVSKSLAGAEERSSHYYQANQSLQGQIVSLMQAMQQAGIPTSSTLPSGKRTAFSDGIYLVGRDIAPGAYDGVVTASVGYWARLRDTDGLVSSIITNGLAKGPFVLSVSESDKAVELRGVQLKAR